MALSGNKFIPVLGALALVMVGFVIYKAVSSKDTPVRGGAGMASIPSASAASAPQKNIFQAKDRPADADKPDETLATLVARLGENDANVQKMIGLQKSIDERLQKVEAAPQAVTPAATAVPGNEVQTVNKTINGLETAVSGANRFGIARGLGFDGPLDGSKGLMPPAAGPAAGRTAAGGGSPQYEVIQPLGYDPAQAKAASVRREVADKPEPATPAASKPEPYITIPENATLTRMTTMTALIGRVPVDGRVQDPMQFKAIVGRDNLAANGFDVPDDVSGIVVSGVAVGDMAMSCNEGHIYSLTFVFDDGTIRTVSNRKGSTGGTRDKSLGYISDEYGNPCISGKFVTNAPAYLTDIMSLRGLGIASKAYAAAQTSTTDRGDYGGTSTSSVTGNRGAFVLGQAAGGAVDEVSNWVTSRLKNSFDAVVTPAGQNMVLHIDQEIAIDRVPNGRRLDHRSTQTTAKGEQHGLE